MALEDLDRCPPRRLLFAINKEVTLVLMNDDDAAAAAAAAADGASRLVIRPWRREAIARAVMAMA